MFIQKYTYYMWPCKQPGIEPGWKGWTAEGSAFEFR
jgi:hypothetical protein